MARPLGLRSTDQARDARRQGCPLGAAPDRRVRPRAGWNPRGSSRSRKPTASGCCAPSLRLDGLPPTPAEIDAFLADRDEKAFERVVDRLLSSEHFGATGARLARCLRGTAIRASSMPTDRAACGRGATGRSAPTTATCRSTVSPSNSLRAIFCQTPPMIPVSPPASCETTPRPMRAARSRKSFAWNTRSTA
jgi:hypothetical protein